MPTPAVPQLPTDLALVDARGRPVELAGFRGEALLLVFLRHLG